MKPKMQRKKAPLYFTYIFAFLFRNIFILKWKGMCDPILWCLTLSQILQIILSNSKVCNFAILWSSIYFGKPRKKLIYFTVKHHSDVDVSFTHNASWAFLAKKNCSHSKTVYICSTNSAVSAIMATCDCIPIVDAAFTGNTWLLVFIPLWCKKNQTKPQKQNSETVLKAPLRSCLQNGNPTKSIR